MGNKEVKSNKEKRLVLIVCVILTVITVGLACTQKRLTQWIYDNMLVEEAFQTEDTTYKPLDVDLPLRGIHDEK